MAPIDVLQDRMIVLLRPSLTFINSVYRFSLNAVVHMVTKIPTHLGRFIGRRIGTSNDTPTSVSIARNNTCNVTRLHQSIDSKRHTMHKTRSFSDSWPYLKQKHEISPNITKDKYHHSRDTPKRQDFLCARRQSRIRDIRRAYINKPMLEPVS